MRSGPGAEVGCGATGVHAAQRPIWRGEPGPGADVAGGKNLSVPVQMVRRCSRSRCRCGRGESLVLAQMWRLVQDLFPGTASGTCCIRCRCGRSEPGAEAGGPELCRAKSMPPPLSPLPPPVPCPRRTHTRTRTRAPAQTTTRARTHRHTRTHAEARRPRGRIDMQTQRQTYGATHAETVPGGRRAGRRTGEPIDRQTDGRTHRRRGRWAGRPADTHTHTPSCTHPAQSAHALAGCLVLIGPNSLGSLLSCRRATCSRSHQLCDPIASPARRAGMRKKEDAARHRGIRRRPAIAE